MMNVRLAPAFMPEIQRLMCELVNRESEIVDEYKLS